MKFLLLFSQNNLDFRTAELEGVCRALRIEYSLFEEVTESSPIFIIDLPNEEIVRKILSRSVLLKTAYEYMYQGAAYDTRSSYDVLHESVRSDLAPFQRFNVPDETWAIRVRPVGRKRNVNILVRPREFCEYLPMDAAPVSMKDTVNKFVLLEHYYTETSKDPEMVYFLREIGDGQTCLKVKLNLKDRCYIGNTTMDPELALIQSNCASVASKSLVLDPFCGTGGLLIPAAEYGATVVGTEINYHVARAEGKSSRHDKDKLTENESIAGNFVQYGTASRFLSIIIADSSRHGLWSSRPIFDAIVADPPYGIREKGRKIGPKERKDHWTLPGAEHYQHFPEKQVYELDSVFCDLVNLASHSLVIGGRVSFWFPVILEKYSEEVLPAHPALELVSNCEQRLTLKTSRRLLTYQKVRHPEADEAAATAHNQYEDQTFRQVLYKACRNKKAKEN